MTFFAGLLLLPLMGMATWRIPSVRRMGLAGRIAIAGAAGALVVAVVMAAMSALHIEWSRAALLVLFALIGGGQTILSVRGVGWAPPGRPSVPIVFFILLTAYGVLTARESAGDLHFFWGPKAIRFFHAGGIDAAVLADELHPNRDYPPLLPLVLAWCHAVAGEFSWFGAVMSAVLCLAGAVALARAASGDETGAVLMAATFSWAFAIGFVAGGADPPLVLFEVLTLSALTFLDDERSADILAAIGLAGAAWTKIEGATFVIAVVIALIVVRRSYLRALRVATPAIVLLGAWLAFLAMNDLVFGYGGATMGLYLATLPSVTLLVAKAGLYELYGLPWIAPLILIIMARSRRAALPLVVAALTLGATVFFYIHLPDPAWWIAASAPRVLMTPLAAVLVAACCRRAP